MQQGINVLIATKALSLTSIRIIEDTKTVDYTEYPNTSAFQDTSK